MKFASRLVAIACVVFPVAMGARLAPAGAARPAGAPRLATALDPCLLGTWTTGNYPSNYDFGGTEVPIYGGAGGTSTWSADGLEVDQYSSGAPLVGTYQGKQLVVRLSGTAESRDRTVNGVLSDPSGNFVNAVSVQTTWGGQSIPSYPPSAAPAHVPYTCSATTLELGGTLPYQRTNGYTVGIASTPDGKGYWTATNVGTVTPAGDAPAYQNLSGVSDVIGISTDPTGRGFWLVGADGGVYPFGDATSHGSLPALGVKVSDIVAIAPTADGRGYWLVGADGGEFAFGDAKYHGSLPGVGVHVTDVVGMVASPTGRGYLMVGADGGVFAFGASFNGSLPGLGVKVDDIVGILPTAAEAGYILVGSDGGAFVFGRGSGFYGSLPGDGVHVDDITGLALTPDGKGYWMVGANQQVYAFGDAKTY